MNDPEKWYEWGKADYHDLGRHCKSIQRGEVRDDLAKAYKAGYRLASSVPVVKR